LSNTWISNLTTKKYMAIINDYLNVLNESKGSHAVSGPKKTGPFFDGGDKKAPFNNSDEVETPEKSAAHLNSASSDSKPKVAKATTLGDSVNPFDKLFNQVLSQENWEQEEEANEVSGGESPEGNLEMNFSGDTETGEGEFEEHGEGEGEGEMDAMTELLTHLRAAVAALEKISGHEEEEEEEEVEEDTDTDTEPDTDTDTDTDEETNLEDSVDAEELGHALVDLQKLSAGLSDPKSRTVKGAVPVSKGKAQTPNGKKPEGKYVPFKGNTKPLEGKKNDVNGVSKGKAWFDQ